jgi:hypothetical protein
MKEIKKEELVRDPRTLADYLKRAEPSKKELARVTERRKIIKKAAGVLSQTTLSGMRELICSVMSITCKRYAKNSLSHLVGIMHI